MDFQKGEMVGWWWGQLQGVQKWERQGRESGISRGWVVGPAVAHGKVHVVVEAEGTSHEYVKDEELADDKSSGSHCGKVRGGRTQGAVQGPLEIW